MASALCNRNDRLLASATSPHTTITVPISHTVRSASVVLRSGTHDLLEHGGEGGRARIAEIEGERRDALAAQQPGKSRHKTGASLPGRKSEAGLALEPPRKGAATDREIAAPEINRLLRARTFEKSPASRGQLFVGGKWQA